MTIIKLKYKSKGGIKMLKKLFLPIFSLILITYAGAETLKISKVIKNEVSKQIINSSVEKRIIK